VTISTLCSDEVERSHSIAADPARLPVFVADIPEISVFLLAARRHDRGTFFPDGRKAFYTHANLPRSLSPWRF
jgi:hypothetical protein